MRWFSTLLLISALTLDVHGQDYRMDTFAGGAIPQNIAATSVNLAAQITGITTDRGGNIYFSLADPYDVIMRLDSAGNITRFAGSGIRGRGGDGGPAVNARLNNPGAILFDASGTLYIADSGNKRIRKVTDGIITTIAGGVELLYRRRSR